MASHWQTYLTLLVVGLVFTGIYFIVFRFLILKFDFKTPGREDDEEEIKFHTKADFKEKQAVNPDYKDRPYQPFTLTMGPKSLMRVKHLVMIVNGKEKAEIFKRFLDEPINQDVPATILKLHPNFTVICDQDAASLIHYEQYSRL